MATGSLHPTDVNLRAEAKVSARREGLQRKKKAHPRQAGDPLTDGDILGLIVYFKYDCSVYDVADTLFSSPRLPIQLPCYSNYSCNLLDQDSPCSF